MSFPILVMTKDEGENLKITVESIINTVSIDVDIFIVDNNSKDEIHKQILNYLGSIKNIEIVRNKKNKWVLGLNHTIEKLHANNENKYFLLTDGDIDFSLCRTDKACWLTYLVGKMESNISIGKIGLSLDWELLESESRYSDILKQEKALYNEKKKINDLFVSQVDTTAAIYRWDWSIGGEPSFYPDHIRYLRPELYSCRTPRDILVKHLGWYSYFDNKLTREKIDDKIKCFTFVGGTVRPEIKRQASKLSRVNHTLFAKMFHKIWIFRRYFMLYKYITLKGRRLFDGQESTEL